MTGTVFRVLITRPAEDAAPLAGRLAALGIAALIEPMLAIRLIAGPPPDLAGVQALLITSANGVRALAARSAARSAQRGVVVFAVGDASAAAARAAGFARIESAAGDVESLGRLVRARLDPSGGALLHVAGAEVAGALADDLRAAGFDYRRTVLYRAATADRLSPAAAAALAEGSIAAVLLYSPRTAAALVRLIGAAGLAAACARIDALCLSGAVARAAAGIAWRSVRTAARPDQDALIALTLACRDERTAAGGDDFVSRRPGLCL